MRRFWFLLIMTGLFLSGCSPELNWRDVRDGDAGFLIQMPDKPAVLSRPVQIGKQVVTMQITAARVGEVRYAVGAARLPDPEQARASLIIIRDNLVNNMAGHVASQHSGVRRLGNQISFVEDFQANNASLVMQAQLIAQGSSVYEVLVVGPKTGISQEAVEFFLGSFRLL